MPLGWNDPQGISPRSHICGYCNHNVGPAQGWHTTTHTPINNQAVYHGYVYICSLCGKPTFFDQTGKQYPGVAFGDSVGHLPVEVATLYEEARNSMTVNAFTSVVLICRKLLMHLAVEKGAPANKSFLEYVEYLAAQGFVPPNGKGWVDYIRKKGNEANHEIKVMAEKDAKDLVTFSEMLLKFVYEFPAKIQPPPASPAPAQP
jgi:hypothetical protein